MPPPLSPLEHEVMDILWRRKSATATEILAEFPRRLSNATIRTVLRRLEGKGFVRHSRRGRTFVFVPKVGSAQAATSAVQRLLRRFFGGSASQLVAGLIDEGFVDPAEIRRLSERLQRSKGRRG